MTSGVEEKRSGAKEGEEQALDVGLGVGRVVYGSGGTGGRVGWLRLEKWPWDRGRRGSVLDPEGDCVPPLGEL